MDNLYKVAHCPNGRYVLTRDGRFVDKRMKQFKRSWRKTLEGAQSAADKLNAANISNAGVPGTTEFV